ncbi:hypothetical protein CC_2525 [Caulobacter vibrioides CB15]|uniref:Uncharacterized protein n=1 Tax=Caulobacter vibrioides (strain ATCC 19089 / CIP 103742 / CB 15) TaxID=190650 RepID=Q9A5C5_CAUVC|nr:hypothetical protein CC_2525 [Caulobacter vibrioides CB15]
MSPKPLIAKRAQGRVIEGAGPVGVAGADGDVADHQGVLLARTLAA